MYHQFTNLGLIWPDPPYPSWGPDPLNYQVLSQDLTNNTVTIGWAKLLSSPKTTKL